jgi:hypothetical protein
VFNLAVAPTLQKQPRSVFRRRMAEVGLSLKDTGMSVGHYVARSQGGSNLGGKLFAQHTKDNTALGSNLASDEELLYYWRLELLSPEHWSRKRSYSLEMVFDEMSRGVGVWPRHGKYTLLNTSSPRAASAG